ncbi:MAG: nuclear transport factor 2 family protein [Vicinamibacteria bacterium]
MRALVLAGVVGLAGIASAQGGAERDVEDALHAGCAAFERGDVPFLESFLGDGFTLTNGSGEVTSREETLAEVRKGEPRYQVFRNSGMRVRLYGDTAVVLGITTVKGTSGGKPFAAELAFTDTLVKRAGRWVIVASHASRAPAPPAPLPPLPPPPPR